MTKAIAIGCMNLVNSREILLVSKYEIKRPARVIMDTAGNIQTSKVR